MHDVIDRLAHLLTRPLCWVNVHTRGCRGRHDHSPDRGVWLEHI